MSLKSKNGNLRDVIIKSYLGFLIQRENEHNKSNWFKLSRKLILIGY